MNTIKVSDGSQPIKIALFVLFLIMFCVVSYLLLGKNEVKFGQIPGTVTATNSTSTASSTVSLALAASSGDQKRTFANTGSNTVYLSEKATSTGFTAGTGIVLTAGSFYEETEALGNLWTGNVWQITVSGTSSLSISQL